MSTVHARELSILRMVAGNEKLYGKVIVDGVVNEWVGIGWVSEGPADADDFATLPTVVHT